ncbi:MAG TPA: DUF4149 domain-containing protein [Tepidisphaeraceae bacterium]|jgi:hypothetical protein
MRTALNSVITLVWGLWFGGVLTLFLTVTAIFAAFPTQHAVAGDAARHVFRVFNAYQLALAAVALLATFAWCLLGRGKLKLGLFLLFSLTTFAACVITMYVAPQIELMHEKGLAQTPEFMRMHGYSMVLYLGEAVMLLIAGLFLPWMRERQG